MSDMPSWWDERFPKARKEHYCDECAQTIKPGEIYQLVVGVWSGDFARFKTCSSCQYKREWLINHGADPEDICYTELAEHMAYAVEDLHPLERLALESE